MAASIYMILGRIILLTDGELHSPIRRRWLTKFFVIGDVPALLAQSSGGGIMSSDNGTNNSFHTGETVIIAGLYIQPSILLRHFRLEYHQGNGGYLISHEVWIYLFDALLMFAAMVWLNWYHPAEIGLLLRGETTTAVNGLETRV
ncbi:hypothetical protein ACHAQH_009101 [Verticillium albo-atrum]